MSLHRSLALTALCALVLGAGCRAHDDVVTSPQWQEFKDVSVGPLNPKPRYGCDVIAPGPQFDSCIEDIGVITSFAPRAYRDSAQYLRGWGGGFTDHPTSPGCYDLDENGQVHFDDDGNLVPVAPTGEITATFTVPVQQAIVEGDACPGGSAITALARSTNGDVKSASTLTNTQMFGNLWIGRLTFSAPEGIRNVTMRQIGLQHVSFVLTLSNPVTAPPVVGALEVTKVGGPNPAGSFTLIPGENRITLESVASPDSAGPLVRWVVADAPDDSVASNVPTASITGAATTFVVPKEQPASRLTYAHQTVTRLDDKAIAFKVNAQLAFNGTTVGGEARTVRQDEIDVIRNEYYELKMAFGVPDRDKFIALARGPLNTGDFDKGLFDPTFKQHVEALRIAWLEHNPEFQINVVYRSPVHNRLHANGPKSSGAAPNSRHVYGCGADLQTFPLNRTVGDNKARAIRYWRDLAAVARTDKSFSIEPMVAERQGQFASTESHVHVQYCPQLKGA